MYYLKTEEMLFCVYSKMKDRRRKRNGGIASAIALRARLREGDSRIDFERQLGKKLQDDYTESLRILSERNARVQVTADRMREQIAGKDNKSKDDVSFELVNSYVKQNYSGFVDALRVCLKSFQLSKIVL